MDQLLKINDLPNVLGAAFEALKGMPQTSSPDQIQQLHQKFFVTLPETPASMPFEKFSLLNPTIKTFVATTTEY
jgi:hypothetical protein